MKKQNTRGEDFTKSYGAGLDYAAGVAEASKKEQRSCMRAAREVVKAYRAGGEETDPLGSYTGNPAANDRPDKRTLLPKEENGKIYLNYQPSMPAEAAINLATSSTDTANQLYEGAVPGNFELPVQDADDL